MTIIRPDQLLDQADRLVKQAGGQQVDLRRAVSAAYYALFHTAAISVSDHVVSRSRRNTREWAFAARSLDHRKLKEVCQNVVRPTGKYRDLIPPTLFQPDLKDFAEAVVDLQEKRHQADYNPLAEFRVSDVRNMISLARSVHGRFNAVGDDEKRLFVCMLIFTSR